jgi:hypothetical protein
MQMMSTSWQTLRSRQDCLVVDLRMTMVMTSTTRKIARTRTQTLKASIFWIAARSPKKWIAAIHFLDRCSYCESICTLLFNTDCCVFSMVKHQFQELEPVHDH